MPGASDTLRDFQDCVIDDRYYLGQVLGTGSYGVVYQAVDLHDRTDLQAFHRAIKIVSKVDRQEVDNALNQAAKEIQQRFDFKNTDAAIAWSGDAVEMEANGEERVKAILDVFQSKLVRRGVSLKALDAGEPRVSGKLWKITASTSEGISTENAKKISKLIRDEGPKGVKAQIQGDELRVSSKKRDDLQAVQALIKEQDYDFAVQFTNYR